MTPQPARQGTGVGEDGHRRQVRFGIGQRARQKHDDLGCPPLLPRDV